MSHETTSLRKGSIHLSGYCNTKYLSASGRAMSTLSVTRHLSRFAQYVRSTPTRPPRFARASRPPSFDPYRSLQNESRPKRSLEAPSFCASGRGRTYDRPSISRVLYQLSYACICEAVPEYSELVHLYSGTRRTPQAYAGPCSCVGAAYACGLFRRKRCKIYSYRTLGYYQKSPSPSSPWAGERYTAGKDGTPW